VNSTSCSTRWRSIAGVVATCAVTACGSAAAGGRNAERQAAADSSAATLLKRGRAAAAIGDLTRAEQYLIAALKAGGPEGAITRELLVVCVADQRFPAALEYAEQHLHRHPKDTEVQFAAASIYAAVGQGDRARVLLEDVVQRRPDWPDAHYVLASVLRDASEQERADRHDLEYLRLEPEGKLAERARARLRRGTP
jgi:predicted Zn-dependent protease